MVIGYLWLSLRGSHGRWCIASTPENTARRICVEQNRMTVQRGTRGKERKREERRREGSRKERTQRDPARGGYMKIFLGMPKTETRADRSSLPPRPRRRDGGPLCDIGDRRHFAVTASRFAPLLYPLPRRLPLFLSSFSLMDTINLYLAHVPTYVTFE